MKKQIKVALDVDGILANFYLTVCKVFKKPYETVKKFGIDWLQFNKISKDVIFWTNLEILNHPESINFDFDIYLTSIPEDMLIARKIWLNSNNYPKKEVIVSRKKATYCIQNNIDVLIDDKPETIEDCKNNKVLSIQYVPYYSEMPIMSKVYIKHLPEVKPILKIIQKFSNIKDELPIVVQEVCIKEYYNTGLVYFETLVDFVNILFIKSKSSDDVLNNLNRWQALSYYKYYPYILTEDVIGKEKYHAFSLLIDEARGSL